MSRVKTVLIVDDDPDFVAMVRTVLSAAGYAVYDVPTAAQGLSAAQALVPDLVLFDAMLSDANDGFAMLRQLRAIPGLAKIPIVLVSSIHTVDLPLFHVSPNGGWVPADLILPKPQAASRLLAEAARLTGRGNA